MPVAKLSREFYERLGDKVTDELVNCLNTIEAGYRTELRDLFEAQFGRFKELFERRLAETKADVRVEIREVRGDVIKWTSAFWVVVALAVIGLYLRT